MSEKDDPHRGGRREIHPYWHTTSWEPGAEITQYKAGFFGERPFCLACENVSRRGWTTTHQTERRLIPQRGGRHVPPVIFQEQAFVCTTCCPTETHARAFFDWHLNKREDGR